ncbi:hypothetical protein L1049_006598 [Liquidambar formosana]|uniref:Transcriptional regulator SLK2 n=1 Tax=Liquidambar formosana TaxID=63359 RepID=A0AAP0WRL0_LIQFO
MALETYLDSDGQLVAPIVSPTRVSGGFMRSSSSDILLQKDGQFQAAVASLLNSSSGNLSRSIARIPHLNAGLISGDMNPTVLNNKTNSRPSVGASSLVTDANSAFTGATNLERSAGTNAESYLNLPGSPASFSSNNLSISGSSAIDGTSLVQQTSHLDQNCRQVRKRQQQKRQQAGCSASQPTSQTHHVSLRAGTKQEPITSTQMHKKPRLDIKQEDILQQQIIQQLLQRQDPMQVQGHNPQLQTLFQQSKLRNLQHQQILQSIPQLQGVDMQQQQQMRHHLQQQALQHVSTMRPFDSGICARRLMQYIYHLQHRPPDNNIAYWRKFVAEYYAPGAKKRWCLSLYDSVGHNALGVFPQAAMDAWQCDICGSKSGRGFEANFEVLPRLNKIKFDSGVIDELLFLDLPREHRFPSGLMILEYGKAVEESVCEQLRVVREGQLRIIFSHDLKILSWEFCAQRHEELLPRRLVVPQVNQLVQAAQRYQSTVTGSRADEVSPQDLKANCNVFVTAGRQLARNLELHLVDDLGFSKRYVRCLQISEVVNSMKDLMTFSRDNNIGPIASLKNYPREATATELKTNQMLEKEQLQSVQCLPTDRKKLMAMQHGLGSNMNDPSHLTDSGLLTGSEQAALALTAYYQKMLRQNSLDSNLSRVKQEPSCSFNSSNQVASSKPFPGSESSRLGSIQSLPLNGLSRSHSSQSSQNIQQCMIQKILQEMMNNSAAKEVRNACGSEGEEVLCGFDASAIGGSLARARGTAMVRDRLYSPANVLDSFGRTNSLKAAPNSDLSGGCGKNIIVKREPDLPEKLHLTEAVREMPHACYENGVFNGDREDSGHG